MLRLLMIFAFLLLITAREIAPGVLTWPLGSCSVDWHQRRALVLACPGVDMLRVWPLPFESPWWEDENDVPDRMTQEA